MPKRTGMVNKKMGLNFPYNHISYIVLILSLTASLLIVWNNLLLECLPHDEGLIGHTAKRFISGELSHRDFDDPYTGLLNIIHSFAFKLFGEHPSSLRYFHFSFYTFFLLILISYLKNFLENFTISLAIIVLTFFSIVIYPTPMPSWYMVYFTFFSGLLIIKFYNTKKYYFLMLAGAILGLTTLLKINGIIFLFAAIWAIYISNVKENKISSHEININKHSKLALIYFSILLPILFYIYLIRNNLDISHIVHFIIPNIFLGINFIFRYRYLNIKNFILESIVLTIFFILINLIFLSYFYFNNGLTELIEGIFINPIKRINLISSPPPHWIAILSVSLLFIASYYQKNLNNKILPFTYIVLFIFLITNNDFSKITFAMLSTIPFTASLYLAIKKEEDEKNLLFWMPFLCTSLFLQYPFFNYMYLAYPFIFSLLFIINLFRDKRIGRYSLLNSILIFLIVLGLDYNKFDLKFNNFFTKGLFFVLPEQKYQKPPYCISDDLISIINEHSATNEEILAFPDSPEIYYFGNRRNPRRFIYDILSSQDINYDSYLEIAESQEIPIVVINKTPCCSPKLEDKHLHKLETIYQNELNINNYMVFYNKSLED